jgi:hypothetical protein
MIVGSAAWTGRSTLQPAGRLALHFLIEIAFSDCPRLNALKVFSRPAEWIIILSEKVFRSTQKGHPNARFL